MVSQLLKRQATSFLLKQSMPVLPARFAHSSTGGRKYERWQDVPDELIPTTSKRDPDNPIYAHPRYIAFRKQIIFFQQDDGLPVYLKRGWYDKAMIYFAWFATFSLLVYNGSYVIMNGVYTPKKRE